jgi:hypothetical protein
MLPVPQRNETLWSHANKHLSVRLGSYLSSACLALMSIFFALYAAIWLIIIDAKTDGLIKLHLYCQGLLVSGCQFIITL